jgi:DNA-directed RNA polymerase subunit beta
MSKVEAIKDHDLNYVDPTDVDYEMLSSDHLTSPHIGAMPMRNAVQPTRLFYGSRFFNQALPLANPQAPWVQAAMEGDEQGRSFDDYLGGKAGALRAKNGLTVHSVGDDHIEGVDDDGAKVRLPLYKSFAYNRKSSITQTPIVKAGDVVPKDGLLARSSYTDGAGTLAMGVNARVGIVPYKGYSMDDAIVISQAMANRLRSLHTDTHEVDFKSQGLKGGLDHFRSIFPDMFHKDQLSQMDEDGVVRVGSTVNKDDPLVLASRPRNFNSSQAALGNLHKVARTLRANASETWDSKHAGKVVDVAKNRDGSVKVVVESERPTEDGDKLVFRTGNKGVTSRIIPDAHMPRTADGRPLEVLLNPMGIPSRANSQLPLEIMLGKVAEKTGQPIKLPGFNKNNDSWLQFVRQKLAENGLTDKEEVFDPLDNRKLERPITVGSAYLLKLHHTGSSKTSSRGQNSYDADGQPAKGGGAGGQSKRLSGLEVGGMISSGAYANLRESSTLRGQKNDDFWRALRAGQTPKVPGRPFVFDKFRALLNGAGLHARDMEGGKLRLGLMTDKVLDRYNPMPVRSGDIIDFKTLAPRPGGLFDSTLTTGNRWGYIPLPEPMPNPAGVEALRTLMGWTHKDLHAVLAGEKDLTQISK